MSNMSNYLEDALVNHILKNTALSSPTQTYIGLFASDAGLESNDLASAAEISGAGYARVQAAPSLWTAPSDGATSNDSEIIFPTATGTWGNVSHVAILDAATNGNVLLWAPLNVTKEITAGDSFRILPNDFDIAFL